MRVQHHLSQALYENGIEMCTTAALYMGISVVTGKFVDVKTVMGLASEYHSDEITYIQNIISRVPAACAPRDVTYTEYVICEDGCTSAGHDDRCPVSCMISASLLSACLFSQSPAEIRAAVLTSGGHSVCVYRKGESYSLFDSSPSFLMTHMSKIELDEQVGRYITGQCDVTVISLIPQSEENTR
jgi:hypothetical protein